MTRHCCMVTASSLVFWMLLFGLHFADCRQVETLLINLTDGPQCYQLLWIGTFVWPCVCVRALGKNESWMQTNSPWLMKAAGPSQSWAQRLRVEYITLKSLTPVLSTALSAGLSSAMQPSRTSTRSPANLWSNKFNVIDLHEKQKHNPGHTVHSYTVTCRMHCWLPVPCWGYLCSIGLWGVSVTGLDLDTAIQQEGTEVAIHLQTSQIV